MSEHQQELQSPESDTAFADLMDVLAPEGDTASAGEAGQAGGAPAGGAPAAGADAGGTAAPRTGAAGGPADTGAAAPTPGAPVAGGAPANAGGTSVGGGTDAAPAAQAGGTDAAGTGTADGGSSGPGLGTAEHSVVVTQLGELSTKFEEALTTRFQTEALEAAKEDYPKYFEALETHPYALMGREVPAVGREGSITLNSTQEAKDWQDAVKHELAAEVRDRASRQLDEQRGTVNTVHASIELFQKNADLVPGTKTFDVELANQFANMAKPYELRVDGKLQGYTIPVQPIIDLLRTQVHAGRTAASPADPAAASAPAAGGPSPSAQAPAAAAPPGEQPQAGIPSRAGTGAEGEDFSTLFGTIGLPHLQI